MYAAPSAPGSGNARGARVARQKSSVNAVPKQNPKKSFAAAALRSRRFKIQ